MFLIDSLHWTAAVFEERKWWETEDKNVVSDKTFLDSFSSGNFKNELIWKLAGQYRVARNFRESVRARFATELRNVMIDSTDGITRFDQFVHRVRELAAVIKNIPPRNVRPLSGSSKLLYHRFPDAGFIYDANAYQAVTYAGLLAPYTQFLHVWGGEPKDEREVGFLIFAASYREFCWPLHQPIGQTLHKLGRDPRRSPRIIDKVLWIAGIKDIKEKNKILGEATKATADDLEIASFGRMQAERIVEPLIAAGK